MSSIRMTALLFLCFLVGGCFTTASVSRESKEVTPVTYKVVVDSRLERSVGKLRRLTVLPVQLDVSPEDPRLCLEKCGWEGLSGVIELDAVTCLREKRGYEVSSQAVLLGEDGPAFTTEDLSKYAKALAARAREGDPEKPSQEVVSLVRELGVRARVDGIVVIQGSATSWTLLDWAVVYASFTLSSPLSYLRIGVSLRADVFETATGRTVWASTLSGWGEPDAKEQYGTVLFERIEPAIPRVFTTPAQTDAGHGALHLSDPLHVETWSDTLLSP